MHRFNCLPELPRADILTTMKISASLKDCSLFGDDPGQA